MLHADSKYIIITKAMKTLPYIVKSRLRELTLNFHIRPPLDKCPDNKLYTLLLQVTVDNIKCNTINTILDINISTRVVIPTFFLEFDPQIIRRY